ncbi:MAG TPA: hypothetical protein VGB37_02245 [Candidatus Lokiarchaeia archaeon]
MFLTLSLIIHISEFINVLFWKLSVISSLIGLGFLLVIHSFVKEYKKIHTIPFLIYSILFGLSLGTMFSADSIQFKITKNEISNYRSNDFSKVNYIFNQSTGIFVSFTLLFVIGYLLYLTISIYFTAKEKSVSKRLLINSVLFSLSIFIYILYIFLQLFLFLALYITFIFIDFIGVCYLLVKKPELFLLLTNKIYYIHIYHKSGILLYSYQFEKVKKETDAASWGNILIGINYILSEFTSLEEHIDSFQTKEAEIIVNYNEEFGFAVLIITNQKNVFLNKIVLNFMEDFKNQYKKELTEIQDLNKIINVSEFSETIPLIKKNFALFLQ